MSTTEIVIARFNEGLEIWREFKQPKTVYNAGQPLLPMPGFQIVQIPNAGQEPAAYLTHITQSYDALADWTVFSQANPSDHCEGVPWRKIVEKLPPDGEGFVPLGRLAEDTLDAGRMCSRVELHHKKSPLVAYHDKPVRAFCAHIGIQPPVPLVFPYGAIFAVDKATIKNRTREFYQRVLDTCGHAPLTYEACLLERLWPYVFNG